MIYGLYHSAGGMLVNEYRQNVLANNLTNTETAGFKRDIAVFAERSPAAGDLPASRPGELLGDRMSGGIWLARTETDYSDGALVQTGHPLDVALDGPGFLEIERDGTRYLTRDGRLLMDNVGRLRLAADGSLVLGRGGAPITLNPYGAPPAVDETGRITQNGAAVGELSLVAVSDPRVLQKAGAGRFIAPEGTVARDAPAFVRGGFIESSGTEPVRELAAMIDASRAYQLNAQMVTLQDQSVGRLINVIAEV
jgi:flagellar basal body rod protein FlgG